MNGRNKMKIIAINCSPRKGQTTRKGLEVCLEAAGKESDDIKTAIVELAGRDIRGCLGCGYCRNHGQCRQDDEFSALIPILNDEAVAAIIIGTPVYLGGVNKLT